MKKITFLLFFVSFNLFAKNCPKENAEIVKELIQYQLLFLNKENKSECSEVELKYVDTDLKYGAEFIITTKTPLADSDSILVEKLQPLSESAWLVEILFKTATGEHKDSFSFMRYSPRSVKNGYPCASLLSFFKRYYQTESCKLNIKDVTGK